MRVRFIGAVWFFLCLFGIFPLAASAQYSANTAAFLTLNGSATGAMTTENSDNWWQVTVPSDGKLAVSTQSSSTGDPLLIQLWMYDQSGTHEIRGYNGDWGVNTTVYVDNLLPGTYHILARRWSGTGTYTISSSFTPTSLAVEAEPNDASAQAPVIPLNGSDSAHLGFYKDGYTDNDDWWQVTIPKDGKLLIGTSAAAADQQLKIQLWMYDQSGTHEIRGYTGDWGPNTTVYVDNLLPGTYYILAHRWDGFGSYTIRSEFTASNLTVEPEPNDSVKVAKTIPLNGATTAHLGFYKDGYTDNDDWWKVTIPKDGKLLIGTSADAADQQLKIQLWMYDQSGTHEIRGYNGDWGPNTTVNVDNLLPGTYYILAHRWDGWGSYTIRSEFVPSSLQVETESNDSVKVAQTIPLDGSATAHLGFYRDGYTDNDDWWKVTVPRDGKLLITTNSAWQDSILLIQMWLYDREGTVQIKSYNGNWGKNTTLNFDNLLPGDYYIQAHRWDGFGSYTITSAFTPSSLAVEQEPNDTPETALTVDPNGSATAHMGFCKDGFTDSVDWWKVTVPRDGSLLLTMDAAWQDSILNNMMWLYDQGGAREIKGYNGNWGKNTTVNYDNLKAGTYYAKVALWSNYGSYRLISSFQPARYAIDTEPNDTRETAEPVVPGTVFTGHLGYFGNTDRDSEDYFSFTVPAGWDTLFVRILSDDTLTSRKRLLNGDGTELTSSWDSTLFVVNPQAGTYSFHNSFWTGYGAYAFIVSKDYIETVPAPAEVEVLPPTQFTVSDVPGDNGHQLLLKWALSASDNGGDVLKYRIFRSRTGTLTDPAPMSQFTSIEALNTWELTHTVLVDSVSAGYTQYTDFVPLNGVPYYYWVQAVGLSGVSKMAAWVPPVVTTVAEETTETPKEFKVNAPYPNPFNPSVTIGYTLPERMQVRLTIYDSLGRVVSVLENREMEAGSHETIWNGRSSQGETLGSGIYLYRVEAGSHRVQGKMTLLR